MNHLNESDLLEVYESVFHARARWYRIGRELNIPSGELDVHREQSHDNALREVLQYWLRRTNPAPTMDKLKEAGKSHTIFLVYIIIYVYIYIYIWHMSFHMLDVVI